MPSRKFLPTLNRKFSVRHISVDFKQIGMPDPQVYDFARRTNRLIVTYNTSDFEEFAELSTDTGIIGISANLTLDQVDKKLTALLTKSKKSDLFGKFKYISGESET